MIIQANATQTMSCTSNAQHILAVGVALRVASTTPQGVSYFAMLRPHSRGSEGLSHHHKALPLCPVTM